MRFRTLFNFHTNENARHGAFFRFIIEAGEGIYSLTLTLRVAVPALPALALRLNPIL